MPYCYNCGEEIYLIEQVLTVKDCICDNCKINFSILEKGEVSQNQLDKAYNDYQHNYFENMKPFQSFRKTVGKMQAKKNYNSVKLRNPASRDSRFKGSYAYGGR